MASALQSTNNPGINPDNRNNISNYNSGSKNGTTSTIPVLR